MSKKVIIALSGGVDSAVAAFLLQKQGYDVEAVFMRNWDSYVNNDFLGNPDLDQTQCQSEKDWTDAQNVARKLGIKIHHASFIKEYWDFVFQDLIAKYKEGKTPNPDILCNKYVKFGSLIKWLDKNLEYDFIATGHYAKMLDGKLLIPKDLSKDQTYFLAQIDQQILKKTIFPLQDLFKTEVREIAKSNNLEVHAKKDSTGICFIGERNFTQFLQNYIPSQPGNIIDITNNNIVGKHIGAMYYTYGQRKGLNLGGMKEPYYVAKHDVSKKIIYVAPNSQLEYLQSKGAIISNMNLFAKDSLNNLEYLEVKFRYRSKSVPVTKLQKISENEYKINYETFSAVTPGQQAVFYRKNQCLGGAEIESVFTLK